MSVIRTRRETTDDVDTIRRVHDLAFGRGDGAPTWESRLVDDLRVGTSWIPALSLVAELDGTVIGHALATRAHIDGGGRGESRNALGLAPVGVVPDHQHAGVGSRLLYALLGAAQALDEDVVCLLGNPAYYHRFGFVLASTLHIEPPDPRWAAHFQVLTLHPGPHDLAGTFRYDEAFDRPV